MKLNKIIVTGMAVVTVLAMAGCGSASNEAASSAGETAAIAATDDFMTEEGPMAASTETMTEPSTDASADKGSVLDYAGAYTEETGKGYSLLLTSTDNETGVYVTMGHMDEEEQAYYAWDIFGEINNNVIDYTDAACIKLTYDPQSENGGSEETVYNDGKGTMTISKDGKITLKDEKINDGEELVFAWDQELNDKLQEQAQTVQN